MTSSCLPPVFQSYDVSISYFATPLIPLTLPLFAFRMRALLHNNSHTPFQHTLVQFVRKEAKWKKENKTEMCKHRYILRIHVAYSGFFWIKF